MISFNLLKDHSRVCEMVCTALCLQYLVGGMLLLAILTCVVGPADSKEP